MKKTVRYIIIVMIIATIIFFSNVVYGFDITSLTGTSIENGHATSLINRIITVIATIGSVTSVAVLIIIGIKYMLGSLEEKAQYKKSLMPYFVGCILVFSASTIAGIVFSLVHK